MRTEIELGVVNQEGKPVVVEGRGQRLLKAKSKSLTLTAQEAVDCGLALGVAQDISEAGKLLGLTSWQETQARGRALAIGWAKEITEASDRFTRMEGEIKRRYDDAVASDPTRFTYATRSGALDQQALRQWIDRYKKCISLLDEVDQYTATASALAKKYPQLELPAGDIEKIKQDAATMRKSIDRERARRGINVVR